MEATRGRWRGKNDERLPLASHLRELRRRLIVSAIAILVGAILGFFLSPYVIESLRVPVTEIGVARDAQIMFTTVSAAFDLRVQIALTIAIVVASPVWLFQIFAFLVPGLNRMERRYTFGFFFSAVPLFFAGAATGWVIFPHMVVLLTSFSAVEDSTFLDARIYYDFVIKLVLATGIAFVLPVFLVLLNFMGVLTGKAIIKGWRVAILMICLFTAFATPAADVVSMFLLAIPMIALYLIAAGISLLHDRRAERIAREMVDESVSAAAESSP